MKHESLRDRGVRLFNESRALQVQVNTTERRLWTDAETALWYRLNEGSFEALHQCFLEGGPSVQDALPD